MDELLKLLGQVIVQLVREEMLISRDRFSKGRGEMSKGRYNFVATRKLYDSVEYKIIDDEIYIIMEDYGVNYVFSDLALATTGEPGGSWPGGGKYYPDTREKGQKGTYSPLLAALEIWVNKKLGIGGSKGKSIAFAVRKNLFKAGYKGLPLFTDRLNQKLNQKIDEILLDDRFVDIEIQDILDKVENIRSLGSETYKISIGL